NSHTIPGSNDDRGRGFQHFSHFFCTDFTVFAKFLIGRDNHFLTKTASNNTDERPVHCITHDVRENCTRRTNQRASNNQQIVCQHKASCRSCPTRVRVEHRNHHWHICPTDGRH